MQELDKEIQFVKGVGPNRVALLNKIGIYTLKDLITYYPRTYEDRGQVKNIAELKDGEEALIDAIAVSRLSEARIRKNMTICKLIVRDETGTCIITWFNQGYLKSKFEVGNRYKFYGKVSVKYGKVEMNSPTFDEEEKNKNTGKIIPLYPLTYNLSQNTIRNIIENGLKEVNDKDLLEETIPEYILKEYKLQDIKTAINQIHFPKEFKDFEYARKRLVFEELLSMQLALINLKNKYTKQEGIKYSKDIKISQIINELPFKLTKAQLKVLEEIDKDMESQNAMNRLLQGDVGSRKNYCFYNCSI